MKRTIRKCLKSIKSYFASQVANWRMERLEVDSKSNSDEEFFDCLGEYICFIVSIVSSSS